MSILTSQFCFNNTKPKSNLRTKPGCGDGNSRGKLSLAGCRQVALEGVGEVGAIFDAADSLVHVALAIEEQEGDVWDAVLGGKRAAFIGFDVGDQILQFAIVERFHGSAGFLHEGCAHRAVGIVNLHDGGCAIADFAEILFAHGGHDLGCGVPGKAATGDGQNAPAACGFDKVAA